jgi:UDP-N-acetylglucosamine 2-epimerase (non-hydrolysing)/GDP/UDP-N,N'-diacetylbacillosamine 2-epimerase (hydrolysing)
MHLSPEFGLTHRQIEADGFTIDAKVEMLLSSDTAVGIAKSMGLGVIGFAQALDDLQPDMLVVLGDRFEILAAAQAALVLQIPIAHIHGGETSEGAFDEGIRHAISKMAQWHFVAAEPYRKRVVQMGESPDRVFNYGAPGLDQLSKLHWLTRQELESTLETEMRAPVFLVTYHPVTLAGGDPVDAMTELLNALKAFPDATVIFTYPNADTGGRALIECIDSFVAKHRKTSRAFVSLGQRRYLSLMREADVIIGNSSSGLTEAPALKKATVNIGDRQKGRLKGTSVIDAAENVQDIVRAIQLALSNEFCASLPETVSLYGQGSVSQKIKSTLKSVTPRVRKPFFDIDHGN